MKTLREESAFIDMRVESDEDEKVTRLAVANALDHLEQAAGKMVSKAITRNRDNRPYELEITFRVRTGPQLKESA